MHYTNIAFVGLLASAAAIPLSSDNLEKRQAEKKFDQNPDGDWSLTFSKASVNLGVRNPGNIMDLLNQACGDTICDTSDFPPLDTKVYTEDEHDDYQITIKPGGDFKKDQRETLFKILDGAAWKAQSCDTVSYRPKFCPPSPQPGICILPEAVDHIICQVPKFWSVQDKDNVGKIFVSIESGRDNSAIDWCEKFVSTAGGIAEAANEAAGIGAGIASIGCKL